MDKEKENVNANCPSDEELNEVIDAWKKYNDGGNDNKKKDNIKYLSEEEIRSIINININPKFSTFFDKYSMDSQLLENLKNKYKILEDVKLVDKRYDCFVIFMDKYAKDKTGIFGDNYKLIDIPITEESAKMITNTLSDNERDRLRPKGKEWPIYMTYLKVDKDFNPHNN
jgi:hypothetical protein